MYHSAHRHGLRSLPALATCLWWDLPFQTGQWTWPEPATEWHILKADVTKAHRRIKIHSQDWRFQVAQIGDEWWVNKVGAYGMASAQLYWGRMAALLLRIIYAVFPDIDWGFVFVDDFAWLLRGHLADLHSTALLVVLHPWEPP